jgi:8-oxo-dGTP diphosphatase
VKGLVEVEELAEGAVWAAGAVPLRAGATALVHRPKYGDWTIPKGKAEPGELLVTTAVREVFEETGLRVRLGPPLTALHYAVGSGPKVVAWWRGDIVAEGRATAPASEIDQVAWLPAGEALERLTYEDEHGVLAEALAWPPTTPLLFVRHAQAVKRKHWSGSDRKRPLADEGKAQLPAVGQMLAAYGVTDLVTSPARRCVDTISPYARRAGLTWVTAEELTEEAGAADRAALSDYVTALAAGVAASGRSTAVCLHRPNLPAMLAAVGLEPQALDPGGVIVAHVGEHGDVVAVER